MTVPPGDPQAQQEAPDLSIVIPVGDKIFELGDVLNAYREELLKRGCEPEFVVVLDGVNDEVFEIAQEARPEGANVRLVRLNHPFGESIALTAGLRISTGNTVVTMPPYLQVDPEDIHPLLEAMDSGLDVVVGYRQQRVDPFINRIQSFLFNISMRFLTDVKLHDMNCPVRAMRRSVVRDLTIQGDMVRFLPIMAHRYGFRVGEVSVKHVRDRRKSGVFGVGVYVRRFLDVVNLLFLSKFTRAPLRFFGVAGFSAMLVGFTICLWLAADFLFLDGEPLRNRALLVVGVVLITLGVQVFAIGLVGEMIIFLQAKNLKEYRTIDEKEQRDKKVFTNGGKSEDVSGGQAGSKGDSDAGDEGNDSGDEKRLKHRVET